VSDVSGLPLIGAAALRARAAARVLRTLPTDTKDAALRRHGRRAGRARRRGARRQRRRRRGGRGRRHPASVLDRLRLDHARIAGVADALRQLVALPDPVGDVVRGSTLANGLQLRQVRVPLGVVGIVYEARPNVTVDAAGLCLKSGNAALLRGSASAFRTNTALVAVLTEAGTKAGLPRGPSSCSRRPGVGGRAAERARRGRRGDPARRGVADPAGGARGAGAGDRDRRGQLPRLRRRLGRPRDRRGDRAQRQDLPGERLQLRETLLVHRDVPFLPRLLSALTDAGVTLHGDDAARAAHDAVVPATDEDWATEYLSMDMAVRVVDDLPAALTTSSVGERALRGDRRRLRAGHRRLHRRGGRRGRAGQRLHPVHRRRGVRLRRRDRHLHAEAARPRSAGPAGADLHQLRRDRQRHTR
jgi:glutamate-5-semialdehyde dehydrogenase